MGGDEVCLAERTSLLDEGANAIERRLLLRVQSATGDGGDLSMCASEAGVGLQQETPPLFLPENRRQPRRWGKRWGRLGDGRGWRLW
jgi:hypothetical protein